MKRHRARALLSPLVLALACATGLRTDGIAQSSAPSRPAPRPANAAPHPPTQDYLAFVASESVDEVALIRFGPSGIRVERRAAMGIMPANVDGPHGVAVSPDGLYYYVTTAHGAPYGYLWKYATGSDSLIGRVTLGDFPATAQISPDGALAFVVNFNLHGEMVPSSVSVVATREMLEVARIPTCAMPHGSRVEPRGIRHYSACMMDDIAVEIDTRSLSVARHFVLTRGRERGAIGAPPLTVPAGAASHGTGGHGMEPARAGDVSCSPTWAQPSANGQRLFVACNRSSDVVEIDVARWALVRRIPAGDGVYNLAVTRDGRYLIGTNKRGRSVSVIDIGSGTEVARIATSRRVVHGAAVSTDDRYVFISQEGVGAEPGAVDVIDLRSLTRVATVDVGQQAGGIDFWRVAPSR